MTPSIKMKCLGSERDSVTFNFSKLKFSTKGLIAFLLGLGTLLQVPQINTYVMYFVDHHPHFATIIAALTAVIGLLHNPTVEAFLGINQTTQQVGDASLTSTSITGATAEDAAKIVAAVQPATTVITGKEGV